MAFKHHFWEPKVEVILSVIVSFIMLRIGHRSKRLRPQCRYDTICTPENTLLKDVPYYLCRWHRQRLLLAWKYVCMCGCGHIRSSIHVDNERTIVCLSL